MNSSKKRKEGKQFPLSNEKIQHHLPIEFQRSWDNNFSFITAIRENAVKIYLNS
jgi:hypothetical protein